MEKHGVFYCLAVRRLGRRSMWGVVSLAERKMPNERACPHPAWLLCLCQRNFATKTAWGKTLLRVTRPKCMRMASERHVPPASNPLATCFSSAWWGKPPVLVPQQLHLAVHSISSRDKRITFSPQEGKVVLKPSRNLWWEPCCVGCHKVLLDRGQSKYR